MSEYHSVIHKFTCPRCGYITEIESGVSDFPYAGLTSRGLVRHGDRPPEVYYCESCSEHLRELEDLMTDMKDAWVESKRGFSDAHVMFLRSWIARRMSMDSKLTLDEDDIEIMTQ